MFKHKCVKPSCGAMYEDEDHDNYYCPSCQEANKQIATKIDSKFAGAPKVQPLSALQEYDAAAKVSIKGMKFLQVKL